MDGNDRRRRRTPWDDLFGSDPFGDLDEEFEEMQRRMNRMIRQLMQGGLTPDERQSEPMIYGFSMRMGSDGKPQFREFGNTTPRNRQQQESLREPLTDVIEEEDKVRVVAEVPGVEKKDIKLNVDDQALDIQVDNPERRYAKRLELPCLVDTDSAKANYKNGVLEVVLDRREKKGGKSIEIE